MPSTFELACSGLNLDIHPSREAQFIQSFNRTTALESHIHLADRPVTTVARVEALWYVEEQSLCRETDRVRSFCGTRAPYGATVGC